MSRFLMVGGAQLGPIAREEPRADVVARMTALLHQAKDRGCDLVVFPELALTTFFPRWWVDDDAEMDAFFERKMPSGATQPLFNEAKALGLGFYLGYAELVGGRHYNTSILVDGDGNIVGKYRKVHLPGHDDNRPDLAFQHLEKRYFDVGDLGFRAWRTMGGVLGMMICNDRRWPESYRVMALQGVEMILLGYNTPSSVPWEPIYDDLSHFHNHLVMQAGAYQNNTWVVGVAKAGTEEDCELIGESAIIAPSGEIVAVASTKSDELITARCDLDLCAYNHRALFNFEKNRQIEHYSLITERRGAIPPAILPE